MSLKTLGIPRKKFLRIELYGGLGNQILIYFAGLALAKKSSRILEIDFFWRDLTHTRDFDLSSFKLQGKVCRRDINPLIRALTKLLWRIEDSLSYRSLFYRSFESRVLGIFRESHSGNFHTSKELEKYILSRKRTIRMRGFFFSNTYFLDLEDSETSKFELLNPSEKYYELRRELNDTPVIGIHLRKWEVNASEFGQLSEVYFLQVLEKLREGEIDANIKVWVFVERQGDLKFFPSIAKVSDKILTPRDLSNPAETLLLMTSCRKLIISNSSFSYCAALLSDRKSTEIYAPWPFRPSQDTPKESEIHLQHWIAIESQWS